jgi:NAD(P)-dependent dehydrogenase (short-subunit alcohol dehydrogenase family)
LEDYPDEAFTKVITLNLQRVFTLTQKCIPLMMASLPEGKDHEGPWAHPANIINIGSVDGIRVPSLQTYACEFYYHHVIMQNAEDVDSMEKILMMIFDFRFR